MKRIIGFLVTIVLSLSIMFSFTSDRVYSSVIRKTDPFVSYDKVIKLVKIHMDTRMEKVLPSYENFRFLAGPAGFFNEYYYNPEKHDSNLKLKDTDMAYLFLNANRELENGKKVIFTVCYGVNVDTKEVYFGGYYIDNVKVSQDNFFKVVAQYMQKDKIV